MAAYYVATAGNDSTGTGAIGSPWLTIAHALASSIAGDTINLKGGDTFTENLSLSSGRTLQSYGTGRATIAGGLNPAITATNCDGVTIANLILTQAGVSNATAVYPGVVYFVCTDTTRRPAGVTVTGCDISGGIDGIGFTASASGAGGWNGITLSNNVVHNVIEHGIFLHEDGVTNTHLHYSAVTISGNTVHDVTGDSNSNTGPGCGIQLGNFDSVTGTGAAQCVISGNHVYSCGYNTGPVIGAAGILTFYGDGAVIRGNVVHDISVTSVGADGEGIDLDLGSSNCLVERNISYHNGGLGFYQYAITPSGSGNVVRFNLFVDNQQHFSDASREDVSLLDGDSIDFYNNTIVNFHGVITGCRVYPPGRRIYNNLFITANGAAQFAIPTPGAIDATFKLEGNAYLSPNGSFLCGATSVDTSLAAWRTDTGREAGHGFAGTPSVYRYGGLMDGTTPTSFAPALQYQLVNGSPLAGAGLDLSTLYGIDPGSQDLMGDVLSVPYSVGAINSARTQAMSWAHAQGTGNASGGLVSSLTATLAGVTAGNLLVFSVAINKQITTAIAVTDTQGNSWFRGAQSDQFAATDQRMTTWWTIAKSSGSCTVTANPGTTCVLTLILDEWSYTGGTPILSSNAYKSGTSTAPSPGAVSVGSADLTYAVTASSTPTGTVTAGTGFMLAPYTIDQVTGQHYSIAAEYLLNNATSPTTPAFSNANSTNWEALGLDFGLAPAGSWGRVQGNGASVVNGSSIAPAFAANVTAGNLLIVRVFIGNLATPTTTVTDSQGNTYTKRVELNTGSTNTVQIWSAVAGTTGANTVTVSPGGAAYATAAIDEYSYAGGATFAVEATNSATGTSTTPSPGSVAVTGNDLVVSVAGGLDTNPNGYTAAVGFSLGFTAPWITGVNHGFATEDYLNATTAKTGSYTLTSSAFWVAAAASFKATPTTSPHTAAVQSMLTQMRAL